MKAIHIGETASYVGIGSRLAVCAALSLAACFRLSAQLPVIYPGGVVNAASYTQPVANGSLVAIFGTNLANGVYNASSTPLPNILGGTSVTIGGVPAPLVYVSPGQINAQVSYSLLSLSLLGGTFNAVVSAAAGSSLPIPVSVFFDGPGIYTADGTGCGQAAALNVAPDGSVSVNSASNSAAPGDFVELFGNGFGSIYSPPADGVPAVTAQEVYQRDPVKFGVAAGTNGYGDAGVPYEGLAPGLVGTDQENIQIPAGAQDGCSVPIEISDRAYYTSLPVTISVHSTRGRCVDPATQSYGAIQLVKTISTGTFADGEVDTIDATFPFGPGLVPPASEFQPPPGENRRGSSSFPPPAKFCPVAGNGAYSVGTFGVSGPNAPTATAMPSSAAGQTAYSQNLPAGFLTGGEYKISASGSSSVGAFQGTVTVHPPIQITSASTAIGKPLTVNWTGGSPTDLVRIALVANYPAYNSTTPPSEEYAYIYTTAAAGSLSVDYSCPGNSLNPLPCSYWLLPKVNQIVVEQMPATSQIPTIPVSGITGNVQVNWMYKFVFGVTGGEWELS